MSNKTQDKILAATTHLFNEQGIRATGIDGILKEAEVSKMSLYKYFASKNDLIVAYLLRQEALFMSRYENIAAEMIDPKDKLLAMLDVYNDLIQSGEFKGSPFLNALSEFPIKDDPVHQAAIRIIHNFWTHILNLANQCGVSQPKTLASQIAMLMHGSILFSQTSCNSDYIANAKELVYSHLDCLATNQP
ncbi:TetR/AcrR family transcriptional regulator [Methylomonas sp. EFPC1]|uniref:TetR/AcrR family transcriptional regulator n=1 Tax=Methylomonas sp. EFPC1 TaxID=2812647 RepID=UPI00196877E7|nr:TetR/AcrR family transcriptional regulator [Methylomonas sp. EFPC1]QSB01231.1 TetR/AcrR family transcriptional regulator [Methylomonas sp. EFPC1]